MKLNVIEYKTQLRTLSWFDKNILKVSKKSIFQKLKRLKVAQIGVNIFQNLNCRNRKTKF